MKLLLKLELWIRRRHHAANYTAQAMTTRQSGAGALCRGIAVVFGAYLGAKQAC